MKFAIAALICIGVVLLLMGIKIRNIEKEAEGG